MTSTVSAFLDDIDTREGLNEARLRLERLGEESACPTLVALAAELEARQASTLVDARWRLHALSDHLEEVLAKGQDVDSALALLEVARQPRAARFQGRHSAARREQDLAALLATHRSASSFVELMSHRLGPEDLLELFACGVQEYVMRGADLSSAPGVQELQAELTRRGHPLAALPPRRNRWESTLGRLLGADDVASAADSLAELRAAKSREDEDDEYTTPNVRLVTHDEPVPPGFAAVVEGRGEEGPPTEVDQRVLRLRPALPKAPADTVTSLLVDLDLPLLKDATAVVCERARLADVAEALYALAVSGARGWRGALGAAYGRLALWRTLEGLGGLPASWAGDALEKRWGACTWYQFNVSGGVGVVCLRPGGTSLALLAVRDAPEDSGG
ncbi:DUF6183 family protein [Myxococcus sp. CA040A]|uniref:DUF6183 family protein n=1 Tax=Myxococcus sp. CA040A TaxID=2741738 RepID=UPI00157BAED1|nr:DUF6183 family protein [Myxococcus sp. CA040A]NTX03333.1 hypothetical protein [Myxococcus sp. CA040A]